MNVAARLEAEAPAGGLMVSRAVREAIEGRLLTNSTPIRAFQEKWDEADWQGAATSPARHAEGGQR
jgi:class 3 adenylate cyclase